ncbi:hypothetical protein XFF6166_670077 [Xanthomonas citri pv. fuscans]|nr:hypothetical protein XFF6166_670077 [Xanthomonas citri pv. fuscans]SOO01707.1 hypothetical protein XFF6960_520077 [Xanthomonas citri pv. fuscans]SOO04277.1 hypothetical protein XFF7767_240118 [Xanthomonas citri pv. fuscans]SOO08421.1 hypothetical protein XFF6970_210075 [Xanthomonas citri pv. fuscans]SOO16699.1 hypothetical protein XFF7766_850118 [Xanthomonas citri pv. fuscans]
MGIEQVASGHRGTGSSHGDMAQGDSAGTFPGCGKLHGHTVSAGEDVSLTPPTATRFYSKVESTDAIGSVGTARFGQGHPGDTSQRHV